MFAVRGVVKLGGFFELLGESGRVFWGIVGGGRGKTGETEERYEE